MGRKQAREGTMKLLYQMEVNEDFSEEAISIYFDNYPFSKSEKDYITDAISKITDNLGFIDQRIERHLEGWNINRLAKIDLAVLRIAMYEFFFRKDIPVEVSINEAIETVKKYSSDEAFKFVNGVLGNIVRAEEEDGE
ncbi:MAG: transcription antitermination factor NusB [Tissierellaceae bacterium]